MIHSLHNLLLALEDTHLPMTIPSYIIDPKQREAILW